MEITKFVGTPETYREKIYEEINAVFTPEIIEITSSAGSKAHITLSMYSVNWIDTLSKSKKEKILEAAQRYKVLMSQHFQDATLAPREVIMGSTQILSHAKRRVK